MMRYLGFSIFLFAACATVASRSKVVPISFASIQDLKLGTNSKLINETFGTAADSTSIKILGKSFSVIDYQTGDRVTAEFWIDPETQLIVQKAFLPRPNDQEIDLKFAMAKFGDFANFKKIPKKCAHFSEIVYINDGLGVMVASRDEPNARAYGIVWGSPEIIGLQISANQNQNCHKKKSP